jgi:hypothetical protein
MANSSRYLRCRSYCLFLLGGLPWNLRHLKVRQGFNWSAKVDRTAAECVGVCVIVNSVSSHDSSCHHHTPDPTTSNSKRTQPVSKRFRLSLTGGTSL